MKNPRKPIDHKQVKKLNGSTVGMKTSKVAPAPMSSPRSNNFMLRAVDKSKKNEGGELANSVKAKESAQKQGELKVDDDNA
jgi:hypothetical protein